MILFRNVVDALVRFKGDEEAKIASYQILIRELAKEL